VPFAIIPIASGHRGGSHGSGFRDRASGRAAHASAGLLLGLDDRQEGAQEQFASRFLLLAARGVWQRFAARCDFVEGQSTLPPTLVRHAQRAIVKPNRLQAGKA